MAMLMAILTSSLIGVVFFLRTPLWLRMAVIYYLFGSAWPIIKAIQGEGSFYSEQTLLLFSINHMLVLFTSVISLVLLVKAPISLPATAKMPTRRDMSRIHLAFIVGAVPFLIGISWILLKSPNLLIQGDFKNIRVDLFYNLSLPWLFAVIRSNLEPIANISFIFILSCWVYGVRKKSILIMLIACVVFLLSDFRKGSIVFALLAFIMVVAPPKGADFWSPRIINQYIRYLFKFRFIPIAVGGGVILVLLFMQYGYANKQLIVSISERVFQTEMALTDLYVEVNYPPEGINPEYLPSVGKRIWGIEDLNAEKTLFFVNRPHLSGERYGNIPVLGLAAYVNAFGMIWGVAVTLFFFIIPVLIYKSFTRYVRPAYLVRAFEVAYCFTFLSIFATGSTRIFSVFTFAHPKTIISLIVIAYLLRICRMMPQVSAKNTSSS